MPLPPFGGIFRGGSSIGRFRPSSDSLITGEVKSLAHVLGSHKSRATEGEIMARLDHFGRRTIRPVLIANTPLGTGRLVASTHQTVRSIEPVSGSGRSSAWVLTLHQGAWGIRGVPYGAFVSGGRLAGTRPPMQAVLPWVMSVMGYTGQRAISTAYAVSFNIGERGVKPNAYLQRTLLSVRPDIMQLAKELSLDIISGINRQIRTPSDITTLIAQEEARN